MIHITWSYKKITKAWVDAHKEEIDMCGMPICRCCKKKLRVGSYVDGHWPYMNDYCFHNKCGHSVLNGV